MSMQADSPLLEPIEHYVAELATSKSLPVVAIAACLSRYAEAGSLLRPSLTKAAEGKIESEEDDRLFFRTLHIVGGARDPLGFAPLLRFLHRPQAEIDYILGDTVTDSLGRIVAGVFDGDAEALFDAILNLQLDEFVRDALFGAATFLTWKGRIDRQRMIDFLERFGAERLAPDKDFVWFAWIRAITLLGLRDLEPAVMAAWDRGAIPSDILDRKDFAEDLENAERSPDDIERFEKANIGYIEDVLHVLGKYDGLDEPSAFPEIEPPDDGFAPPPLPVPAINPWRHVGRNDPCPCGSGKKAKRCCLAA